MYSVLCKMFPKVINVHVAWHLLCLGIMAIDLNDYMSLCDNNSDWYVVTFKTVFNNMYNSI